MNELPVITCDEFKEELMTAGLTDLRGEGNPVFARHLADCAACAALADELIRAHGALDQSIRAATPRQNASAAAQRAIRSSRESADGLGARHDPDIRRALWAAGVTAAAASFLATTLLGPTAVPIAVANAAVAHIESPMTLLNTSGVVIVEESSRVTLVWTP